MTRLLPLIAALCLALPARAQTTDYVLEIQVAWCVQADISAYIYDPDDPYCQPLGQSPFPRHLWEHWFRLYILQEYPLGLRVFCGVELPEYSTDRDLAAEAAASVNVPVYTSDTAHDICERIRDALWEEPEQDGAKHFDASGSKK